MIADPKTCISTQNIPDPHKSWDLTCIDGTFAYDCKLNRYDSNYQKSPNKAPEGINFEALVTIDGSDNPTSWELTLGNTQVSGRPVPAFPKRFLYTIAWPSKNYKKSFYLDNLDSCTVEVPDKISVNDGKPVVTLIQWGY